MNKTCSYILFLILFFAIHLTSPASNGEKKQYQPTRISIPPVIDGIPDDDVWINANWEAGFIQHEPNNGRDPSQQTEFSILYDDDNLYVGFKAWDTAPDSIITRLTRRDNSDGDFVGIGIDSYFDQRTAFILGVTAGGTRFDFIMSNNGSDEDPTWDPNWWAKTHNNDKGWTAEFKIPLSQLRFKKNGSGIWGLEAFRQIHRHAELSFWQHVPANSPGMVHLFGEMTGMGSLQPRRHFDITPYLVAQGETYKAQAGNPFSPGREGDLKGGVDAKIGVTSNFIVDLTINPDFGQIEADPSQVNLSAFETFFQEKRPFFIEGRNISSFSLGLGDGGLGNDNLFYSRRIGRRPLGQFVSGSGEWIDRPSFTNIIGAAKLTGKTQDGLSVAIIESVTGDTYARINNNGNQSNELIEPLSNYFVSRVQQDFDNGNLLIGGIFTSTHRQLNDNLESQMHQQAYTGGLDFSKYFREKTWMININSAFSHVSGSGEAILRTQKSSARYFQRPDADHVDLDPSRTSLTGTGGRMQVLKTGDGHWSMMAAMLWKSPQFEINDIGYMREADQLIQVVWVGYREWEPRRFYRSFNINMNQYNSWNFGLIPLGSGANVNGFIRFMNYWSYNMGIEYSYNNLSDKMLRGGPAFKQPDKMGIWLGGSTDERKKFAMRINGYLNNGVENNYLFYRLGSTITYKPADKFNFSFSPSYSSNYDVLQYVSQRGNNGTASYIFGTIDQQVINFSFRVNWALTPDLTIQYWGQPFVAAGKYADFKLITDSKNQDFNKRFEEFTPNQIAFSDGRYQIDYNLDGITDFNFDKPDFNVREFLSNLVLRWEFNPGSAIYLVWNQSRSLIENQGNMNYIDNLNTMFTEKPHNIFLIKASWRLGIKS